MQKVEFSPGYASVEIKTKDKTFNHTGYYVIHNHMIWYKSKNDHEGIWKHIYFGGFDKGRVPVEIQADGANLVVLDDQKNFHYKKVIEEKRKPSRGYSYKEISHKDNWIDRWFTFPIVEKIYHLFGTKVLQIPEGCKGWAISHRGKFSRHFEDIRNVEHPEFPMVTTIYALTSEGKIIYADPYLINKFNNSLEGPHPEFIGEMISASSSTVFLFGTLHGEPKLYTILADFDTTGRNPTLKSFWHKKFRSDTNWKEHPLPQNINEIHAISISQVGEGNNARLLQLLTDEGVLQKQICEEEWC